MLTTQLMINKIPYQYIQGEVNQPIELMEARASDPQGHTFQS